MSAPAHAWPSAITAQSLIPFAASFSLTSTAPMVPRAPSEPYLLRKPAPRIRVAFKTAFSQPFRPRKPPRSNAPLPSTKKSSAIDPNYAPAYINLGTIHFHLRQFTKAEDLYRRATVADPGYVLAFFDLGNVLDELQRLEESIAAYRRAVALAPRYADAHYNLALAHERRGERRHALRHWQVYVALDTVDPGPSTPAARSTSSSVLRSSPSPGAQTAMFFPEKAPPRSQSSAASSPEMSGYPRSRF